jgi:hypothetical protein
MPRGLTLDIRVSGSKEQPLKKTEERTRQVADRMNNAQPAFKDVARILQKGELKHFALLRGKYVRTGATLASLTQETANGAIRKYHGSELLFGTSIPYARYLRKGPRSAVLVLKPKERKASGNAILDYIVHGVHGATKGAVR